MDYNKHIDFSGMFYDLIDVERLNLEQHKHEASHYMDILNMIDNQEGFELMVDESTFCDERIVFFFCKFYNDANESDTQGSSANYIITYDRILDEFTECEYEQC